MLSNCLGNLILEIVSSKKEKQVKKLDFFPVECFQQMCEIPVGTREMLDNTKDEQIYQYFSQFWYKAMTFFFSS